MQNYNDTDEINAILFAATRAFTPLATALGEILQLAVTLQMMILKTMDRAIVQDQVQARQQVV